MTSRAPAGAAARRRGRRYGLRASVGLGVVGLAAGLLFSTSASNASDTLERRPQNLRDLVRVESERLDKINAEVTTLRGDYVTLLEGQSDRAQASTELSVAAGTVPVSGPGVEVRLWDAPVPEQMRDGLTPDDFVIHQQDIEAVMNALWVGGAEAMTVMDHRVTAATSIRCVGNVLLIDGAIFSPPYVVSAIGDIPAMQQELADDTRLQDFRLYVDHLGLGWSVTEQDTLEMAAFEGDATLEHADVPG